MSSKRYDKRHCVLQKGEYQINDHKYSYRWTDCYGKRHAIYASDLDDLRLKEQRVELNKLEGIKEAPASLTIEGLYETWRSLKRGIKASTQSSYVYAFDSLIRPSFGKKRVVSVKRSDVRAFYLSLLEERGLSIGTVENVHNVLQQVFQYAVDDDLLRKNPCDRVLKEIKIAYSSLKGEKRRALSITQQCNFLKFIYEDEVYHHWFPTFFILINTGLRVGELTGLRWQDVDLERGIIDVNHTLAYIDHRDGTGGGFVINSPKTVNGYRKVIMTDAVKDAFRMEKEYQEQAGIESKDEICGYEDFIFINRFGHVQHQGPLNKAIRRIIRDYNVAAVAKGKTSPNDMLPHFSCHVLRHTYATRAVESGVSVKYLQTQMGHSEIQITMDYYVSPAEEFSRKETQSFEKYMNSVFSTE